MVYECSCGAFCFLSGPVHSTPPRTHRSVYPHISHLMYGIRSLTHTLPPMLPTVHSFTRSLPSVYSFSPPIHHPCLSHLSLSLSCRGFTQTEMLLPKLVIVATVLDMLSAATGEGGPAVSMEYFPSNGSTEGMLIAGDELWARKE